MITPDKATFLRDAAAFTVIPVFQEVRAEFETPLSIYLKSGGMFLLESIERGENVGRYSIIARGRKAVIMLRGQRVEIRENGAMIQTAESANPRRRAAYFSGSGAGHAGLLPFTGEPSATPAMRPCARKTSPFSRTKTASRWHPGRPRNVPRLRFREAVRSWLSRPGRDPGANTTSRSRDRGHVRGWLGRSPPARRPSAPPLAPAAEVLRGPHFEDRLAAVDIIKSFIRRGDHPGSPPSNSG
jgi:hypothetical protein